MNALIQLSLEPADQTVRNFREDNGGCLSRRYRREGRRFESCFPDKYAEMAELAYAPDLESGF